MIFFDKAVLRNFLKFADRLRITIVERSKSEELITERKVTLEKRGNSRNLLLIIAVLALTVFAIYVYLTIFVKSN